jgi:hypothetical protein
LLAALSLLDTGRQRTDAYLLYTLSLFVSPVHFTTTYLSVFFSACSLKLATAPVRRIQLRYSPLSMQSFRDGLLSPVPKGPSDITKLDDSAHDQQSVRECIARGEIEQVRLGALTNRTCCISDRYCAVGDGVDSLEGYLHSIWHIYYELSRLASHESADQDRLVLDIVRIQGLGPLTRPVSGNYGIEIARTVQGTLWNDLPFLATDMTDFWVYNCAPMSGIHRLNFASFLAKLASTRVSNHKICQIALVLFRSTFEETRELFS